LARSKAKTLGNLKVHRLNKIIFENENCGKKTPRKEDLRKRRLAEIGNVLERSIIFGKESVHS